MPNRLIDELLRVTSVAQVSARPENPSTPANEAMRALTVQIDALRGVYQTQVSQTSENTAAVAQNTRARATETLTTAANIARSASSALGGGLSFVPLISGIAKLFGSGGGAQELPALPKFALPAAVDLEGGINRGGTSPVAEVSYGQNGLPRAASPVRSGGTNISVNVQTIDSRSFLDHSDDIARAVREAMLNSHALNDVIAEI
jgi:hypothetical protein